MNTTHKPYKKYIALWLLAFALFITLSALFNYSVDPYGLFDTQRIKGFNLLKPAASTRVRITKPYQVNIIKPRTIIAGNSRPEIGLDPANNCWPDNSKPAFNLSLPGASVYMASRYIQHAIANNNIATVIWGLDFMDFINDTNKNTAEIWPPGIFPYEERLSITYLGKNNNKYNMRLVKDHLGLLLSLDSLKDSTNTIFRQSNTNTPTIRRDGFRPGKDFQDIMALEGQGLIFKQVNIDTAEVFYRPNLTLFTSKNNKSEQFESVRQLLIFAKNSKLNVVLFINPYHSDYLATIQMAGLWEQFSSWKKQLTYIADEHDVKLWDFSGFNDFSNTQPPLIGDNQTILDWFWEPAHYRRQYGNLMLSQILGRSCHADSNISSGTLLTRLNIDSYLAESDNAMKRYISDYPQAAIRLKKLFNKYQAK